MSLTPRSLLGDADAPLPFVGVHIYSLHFVFFLFGAQGLVDELGGLDRAVDVSVPPRAPAALLLYLE